MPFNILLSTPTSRLIVRYMHTICGIFHPSKQKPSTWLSYLSKQQPPGHMPSSVCVNECVDVYKYYCTNKQKTITKDIIY